MPPRLARLMVALVVLTSATAAHVRAQSPESILGNAKRLPDGHYLVTLDDGTTLTTHGPDPAPNHGGGINPGDPERAPLCATDYYQHVLYGRLSSGPDRLASVKASLQSSIRRINAVLNEESIASGDMNADYKVLCDPDGSIRVDSFASSSADFPTIVDAARAAGFTASNADYSIFFDAQPEGACGIGSITTDERLVESNLNNSGGDYAVSYGNCWTNETPMHENGHNQGAVQYNAPYSTGSGWHCYDESDVMCYSPDGGDRNQGGTIDRCTDRIHFDCGNDTYFDPAPEDGEYLATHWNLGSPLNRFITFQPVKRPPVVGMNIECTDLQCSFTDLSTDEGSIVSWSWDFGDGAASSARNPAHTYAEAGTYVVSLTVTDNDAMSATGSHAVTVPNSGDPDPSTPNLTNGVTRSDTSAPDGAWKYYKIRVPQGRQSLTVTLTGPDCAPDLGSVPNPAEIPLPDPFLCNPDLDLYVRQGQRPDRTTYVCRPYEINSHEQCSIPRPGPGYWYIGVLTAFATPSILNVDLSRSPFTVTAAY